jgi:hypothetical protein
MRFCDLFKNYDGAVIRNFSLPWHDPAYLPSTELGKNHLLKSLETQILAVDVVFVLADLLQSKACLNWISIEVDMAKRFEKPVFVVAEEDCISDLDMVGLQGHEHFVDFSIEGLRQAFDKLQTQD